MRIACCRAVGHPEIWVHALVGVPPQQAPCAGPALVGCVERIADEFVDTGVAHLAAAVGVATVTLFGPTDRRLTAPRGRGARVLDRAVPCAPCFLPTCPIDHICLTRIDPETVLHEVRLAVA